MKTRALLTLTALIGWALTGLLTPATADAHCDSLDGPVVNAARAALESENVDFVLVWVRPGDETEIREAFDRTLKVRRAGEDARELADRWFFETLVRVHRAGEGAPYTGLKPAGYEPPEGIAAADRAIEDGSGDALATRISESVAAEVLERFERVDDLRDYDPGNVEGGRAWVHAYVEYIHFVEGIHEALHGEAHTDVDDTIATAEPRHQPDHEESVEATEAEPVTSGLRSRRSP